MTDSIRVLKCSVAMILLVAVTAGAQTQSTPSQAPTTPSQSSQPAERPAVEPGSTTFLGDTGLWFVPTGEVVPDRMWSASGYRTNIDRFEGFSDISDFLGTFGYGLRDRVELFGSFRFYTRIDVDRSPVASGGLPMDYSLLNSGWETGIGDFYVGAKYNLMSQWRQQPAAVALRGVFKIPAGDEDKGLGTGEPDFLLDAIVSKEVRESVEIAGHGGLTFRGDPDNFDTSHGFRWGVGAGFPTRRAFKIIGELRGESYFDGTVATSFAPGTGPEALPASYDVKSPVDAMVGVQYHHSSGFFAGGGVSWALNHGDRADVPGVGSNGGDTVGFQGRIGYHPGRRVYRAPAPPPPPPPAPAANRPPTVKVRCEPCTVQTGRSSTVTADEQDPDGDVLTNKWSAPAGTFANPGSRQTVWTAPDQEGPVQVTKTVDDGKGGTASDTVTIQVVRAPVRQYTFEDVHFDFDRYSLRPDATRILDEAVKALQENPDLRITIEGHTCNIGTAEYNLALGDRRAAGVREYLGQRGIGANRLQTISYGEERPKYDNNREETRRLNRRAALTVRIQ